MLITDITVQPRVNADAIPVLTVTFCGDGGDCITVDIADTGRFSTEDRDAVIEHAKVLLVQTATFAAAANDYDARSNGDFDEVEVTDVVGPNDQAFHFEFWRDSTPVEEPARFHKDEMEAGVDALKLALNLLASHPDSVGTAVRVKDSDGRTIREISFEEARVEQARIESLSRPAA